MDELIMQRVKKGDQTAFSSLYSKYAEYALRVAIAVTKSEMLAADAVQQTFIRVFYNAGSYDSKKPFRPWFYRILINECNRLLKSKQGIIYLDDVGENSPYIAKIDEHKFEEHAELYEAIKRLDDSTRIAIVLKYLNGFRESEIADILDLNINTVKSRLFKGRQKLKEIIESLDRRNEK